MWSFGGKAYPPYPAYAIGNQPSLLAPRAFVAGILKPETNFRYKSLVVVGRRPKEVGGSYSSEIDVDLSLEGDARHVSRQQALVRSVPRCIGDGLGGGGRGGEGAMR